MSERRRIGLGRGLGALIPGPADSTAAPAAVGGAGAASPAPVLTSDRGVAAAKVTARDGTVTTFKAVGDPPATAPASGSDPYDLAYKARWMAASVEDVNGNEVNYGYSCP